MTITHRTLLGEDGQPEAALIPWDVFIEIRELIDSDEPFNKQEKETLGRRSKELREGTVRGLGLEELKRSVQAKLA